MAISARRAWTDEELRTAVQRLIDAAHGRKTDAPAAFHVSAQPTDADLMLNDAISELAERRAERHAIETTASVLKRLTRYYDGRARAARKAADGAKANPAAQLHHALDSFYWVAKGETVRKVADNLGIQLPAEALMHPIEYLPEGVQVWLREVGWPEERWDEFCWENEMLPAGETTGSDGQRWKCWKQGEHVAITVLDEREMPVHQARFRRKEGVWTRVLPFGEVQ